MKPLVVLLLVALAGPASAAHPVASRISIDADQVTLADLSPDAPAAWSRVALGRAPRPGGVRTLDREWILQRARQVGAEEDLDLAGDVVLERPGQTVGRDDVVRAVTDALTGRLGRDERFRVLAVGVPGMVPTGDLDLRVRLPEGPLPSPVTLWVDVFVGTDRVSQGWGRVEIFRGRPVVALVRPVRRGEVLGPEDVEVRAGEATAGTLTDPTEVVGQLAVRSLAAGTVLSNRDLDAVPAVQRGDTVRLVARVGAVAASALGKSLTTAAVGEHAEVQNLASGRTLAGVVREGGVVDVTPGVGR